MTNRQFLWLTGTALLLLTGSIVLRKYSDCLANPPITGCPEQGPIITKTGGGLWLPPPRQNEHGGFTRNLQPSPAD